MSVKAFKYVFTTDASGNGTAVVGNSAGTVVPPIPANGYLVKMRMDAAGTAVTAVGGTAVFTVTNATTDGGTVAKFTGNAAWEVFPSVVSYTSVGGTTAYSVGGGSVVLPGVPVDDYLKLTVTTAQLSKTGTVWLFVDSK